jgi:hypothetical protein
MGNPQFLESLMRQSGHDVDDQPKTHPIDELAQAMELRDRFRRAAVTTEFQPGMLCREKRGMATIKLRGLVMFWRWLDPKDAQDAAMIDEIARKMFSHRHDCIIGIIDAGGDLAIGVGESWRLEPCDGEFPEDAPA